MASAAKRRSKGSKASDGKRKRKLSVSDEDGPAFLSSKYAERPTSKIYNSRFNHTQPAELFRKDLISAMKLPDSEPLGPDDYWLIEDSWRPEWEKGVQVPVDPDQLPEPEVRSLRKRKKESNFRLPKKLIRFTRDSSYNPDYHIMSYTNTLSERTCRYDIDDSDSKWLMSVNNDREDYGLEPLEESFVEQVIEELEDQSYVNFQEVIKSEEGLGVEYDEDAICDVCRSPESMDFNEMVFCDSCNICVHQICYGITKIPKGSWICRTCALGIRPPCVLCPNRGGAMKTTRCGQNWAHVGCAVWIPEVSFLNFVKMEPIIKVSQIPASRWNLVCSLCKEKTGACITCAEKGCKTAFHVTCAFNEGLQMRTTVKSTYNDDDDFKAYCQKHTQKISPLLPESDDEALLNTSSNSKESLTSEERANLRKQKIQEKEAEFYNYVNIDDVVNMFECDRSDIETIFNYWKLKRKTNFNRPFLTPKVDTENSCTGENSPLALLKKMVHHRQDLERARNLCYMVGKREKQTKRWIETKEKIFFKQLEILKKQGKTLSPEEKEAVINANDGDIAYDKKYAGENGPSPNMVSVLTNLVGEDAVKSKLNGLAKSPTKKLDRSKGERTPNPYAKHYLNGLMKRSQRWYPVAGSKPEKSRHENELQKDSKSNQNLSLLSSSDHMLSSDGHELSEPKTDSHFESDSCVSQPEEVFKSDVESCADFDNPEPASFSDAKENIFSSVELKEGLNGTVNGSCSKEYSSEELSNLDLYVYPLLEMQADDTSLLSNVENVLPVTNETTSSNCITVEVKPDVEATKTDSCESNGGDKKQVEDMVEKSQHKLKSKAKSLSKKKEFDRKNSVGEKSDLKKNSKIFNSKAKNDGKERDISTNGKNCEVSLRTSKEHCKNENHSKNSKSAMKSILGSGKVSKPKKNIVKNSELLNLPQKSNSTEDKPSSSDITSSDLDLKSIVDSSCKVSLERLHLEQSSIKLPLPIVVLKSEDIVNINNNASINKSNAIKTDDKSVAKDSTPSDILNVIDKRDKSSVSSTNSSCESKSDAKFRPLPTKNSVTRTQSPVHMKVVENGAGKLNKCNPKPSSSEKPSTSLKAKALNTAAAPSNSSVNKHSSSSPSTTKCQEKAATPVSEENSADLNASPATKEKPVQMPPVMPVNNLRNYRIPKKTTRDNSLDLKRGSSPLSPLPDIASSNLGSGYQTKVPKSTWRTLEPKNATSCKSRTTANGDCQQPSERLVLKLTKDPDLQRWKADPNNYNRGGMPPVWHGDFMPGHIPPLLPPPLPPFVPNRWPPRMRDQGAYGLHPNFNRPGHYT